MSNALLEPPTNASPETALTLSQRAKAFFATQSSWLSSLPYPLSLFINTESQEKWQIYENLFLACLRTGDNEAAALCLSELSDRFGQGSNDRVLALQGLLEEALAKDDAGLAAVMQSYNEILKEDPTVFSIRKRRAALLRSVGKTDEAIKALTNLLDSSPTDAETWAELGDLYLTQGLYEQATFCLEEVLLMMPNAWNMHARLGEVLLLAAGKTEATGEQLKVLSESMRRFCRSIELCDDYLRGYYGLKLVNISCLKIPLGVANDLQVTSRLLATLSSSKKSQQSSADPITGDLAPPTIESVKNLNALGTSKLAEIVRRSSSGEKGWDGFSESELIAARELLNRDAQKIER